MQYTTGGLAGDVWRSLVLDMSKIKVLDSYLPKDHLSTDNMQLGPDK